MNFVTLLLLMMMNTEGTHTKNMVDRCEFYTYNTLNSNNTIFFDPDNWDTSGSLLSSTLTYNCDGNDVVVLVGQVDAHNRYDNTIEYEYHYLNYQPDTNDVADYRSTIKTFNQSAYYNENINNNSKYCNLINPCSNYAILIVYDGNTCDNNVSSIRSYSRQILDQCFNEVSSGEITYKYTNCVSNHQDGWIVSKILYDSDNCQDGTQFDSHIENYTHYMLQSDNQSCATFTCVSNVCNLCSICKYKFSTHNQSINCN